MLRDGLTPPDLIIIDGGQGQVNVAKQVIEQELGMSIPIAGLQKNDKHQTHELLFGNPLEVVELPRNSQEFSSCIGFKMRFTALLLSFIVRFGQKFLLIKIGRHRRLGTKTQTGFDEAFQVHWQYPVSKFAGNRRSWCAV